MEEERKAPFLDTGHWQEVKFEFDGVGKHASIRIFAAAVGPGSVEPFRSGLLRNSERLFAVDSKQK